MKGYAEAHRNEGGYKRWVYDEFQRVYDAIDGGADVSELTAAVEALETAVGDNTKGLVKELADLEVRVKALEDAS